MSKVYIKVGDLGRVPTLASHQSAGADMYVTEDIAILPGETRVLPMDFIIALEPGTEAQVRPRSGLSLKTSLRVANSPGTIDSDYRNEVGVIVENVYDESRMLANLKDPEKLNDFLMHHREITYKEYLGNSASEAGVVLPESFSYKTIFVDKNMNPAGTIYLKSGERIAQLVIAKYEYQDFELCDNPEEIGENRGGGFGHSGI